MLFILLAPHETTSRNNDGTPKDAVLLDRRLCRDYIQPNSANWLPSVGFEPTRILGDGYPHLHFSLTYNQYNWIGSPTSWGYLRELSLNADRIRTYKKVC